MAGGVQGWGWEGRRPCILNRVDVFNGLESQVQAQVDMDDMDDELV